MILVKKRLQVRQLAPAENIPHHPEIEKHDLPPKVAQADGFAVQIPQGKVRGCIADVQAYRRGQPRRGRGRRGRGNLGRGWRGRVGGPGCGGGRIYQLGGHG